MMTVKTVKKKSNKMKMIFIKVTQKETAKKIKKIDLKISKFSKKIQILKKINILNKEMTMSDTVFRLKKVYKQIVNF